MILLMMFSCFRVVKVLLGIKIGVFLCVKIEFIKILCVKILGNGLLCVVFFIFYLVIEFFIVISRFLVFVLICFFVLIMIVLGCVEFNVVKCLCRFLSKVFLL